MRLSVLKRTGAVVLALAMLIGGVNIAPDSTEAAKKASLSSKKMTITVGSKKTIKIKKKSSKCTYSFISSKKKVATVNKKGVVTGVKKGKADITVREKNKKTKKSRKVGIVKVTVSANKSTATPVVKDVITPTHTPVIGVITPSPTPFLMYFDFSDNDISKFKAQGDGVKLELSNAGYNDNACLKASGREYRDDWFYSGSGMGIDLAKYLEGGKLYSVTCYVMCDKDATMTMKSISTNSGDRFAFPSQVGEGVEVKSGQWSMMKAIYAAPDKIGNSLTLFWDANNSADIYVDSIEIAETKGMDSEFKDLFSMIFGNIGTCNTYRQMRDNKSFTTSLYNSVTMENETKPNTILTGNNFGDSVKVSNTLPEGYILPSSYKDSKYLDLSFSEFDNVINTAYEYGFRIRFHVLVWHSQTPAAFFKKDFDSEKGYVTPEVMNGRMEYYIRNVINHIYNTPHGKDVVYCIDVVNEYFHNYDKEVKSPWNTIYYPSETSEKNRTNKPEYVKRAFEITYDELTHLGIEDSVKLFYNDYNTYEVSDDIVTMINYINEDNKICAGVGMQCHLNVDYPTPERVAATVDKFAKEGFEVQISELDVTDYNNSGKQADYYANLIYLLVKAKKDGANITGLTFWGLCDNNSWRSEGKPLLFSTLFSPKDSYYRVIDAAKTAWNQ